MTVMTDIMTHMGVFPVVDDLLHVVERIEQEVISPFHPVYGHSAIFVHTGRERVTADIKNTYSVTYSLQLLSVPQVSHK